MYHPRLQQSATRMRHVASSKLYFIIVIGFLVVHIATSLKFGGYGRLSRCKCSSAHSEWQSRLSAVTQGGQFSLDWYVESNLISKKVMAIDESPARVVNPTFISTTSALQSYTESKSYVILVDLSVRSIQDLRESCENFPFWSKFCKKLDASKQSLAGDKFLYCHDVGVEGICKVAVARLPLEMYQMLDLGKKLSEVYTASSTVVVSMASLYGESALSPDMCGAVLAGAQISRFKMPCLKMSSNTGSADKPSGPSTLNIEFIYDTAIEEESLSNNPQQSEELYAGEEQGVDEDDEEEEEETDMVTALRNARAKAIAKAAKQLAIEDGTYVPKKRTKSAVKISPVANLDTEGSPGGSSRPFSYWRPIGAPTSTSRSEDDLERLRKDLLAQSIINDGTNIARALAALPPNILNPYTYTNSVIKEFARIYEWDMTEWTAEELRVQGCGAFYAVTKGNRNSTDRLIRLKSSPKGLDSGEKEGSFPHTGVTITAAANSNANGGVGGLGGGGGVTVNALRPVVLVGKGVCYDTGGINLKSASSMKTMKHDMGGSAAALGTFLTLTQTGFPYPVECWLAIAENNVDSEAYRPDDVITSVTGETIEVVHTDAEGRMLLADVLALASRKISRPAINEMNSLSPRLLVDFATLTGTCISSLSNRYIGAFTNRKEFSSEIIRAGEKCGERVWTFPLDEDFEEDLKSDIADILQCKVSTEADHIYATLFLKRFVNPTVPWVHLDLGSSHRPGGLGHVDTDFTGSGVRAASEIIRHIICNSDTKK